MIPIKSLPVHACDICPVPGQCCKNFPLNIGTFWEGGDEEAAAKKRISDWTGVDHVEVSSKERFYDEFGSGLPYVFFKWRCTKLSPRGRCTIYDSRPDFCRDYPPGYDAMCVFFPPPSKKEV